MSCYEFGPYRLEERTMLLTCDGVPVALGPKVVETLLALIERAGEVCSKSELLDRIWPEGYVEEANLAQNVYVLRKTLRARWPHPVIETIPRRGYRFVAPVRRVETSAGLLVTAPQPSLPDGASPERAVQEPRLRRERVVQAVRIAAVSAAAAIALTLATGGLLHRTVQARQPELTTEAARVYAIGRFYWNRRTESDVRRSIAYFERVVTLDPRSARGYAALAQAYAIMADYGYGPLPRASYFERARGYALQALRIDPASAAAHAALGLIAMDRGDSQVAQREFLAALASDPNEAAAHQWYGTFLLLHGEPGAALRQLRIAAHLDPLSVATASWLSNAALTDHRYAEAIAYAREAADMDPQRADAWQWLGLAYEAEGRYPQAIAAYRTFARTCRGCRADASALLAHAYAMMHRPAEARSLLHVALRESKEVFPADLASALLALGYREEALRVLARLHPSFLRSYVALDPRLAPLRRSAAFNDRAHAPA
jgi:DNA-binding winged helix-turn-helix (wHTH) protein/tetratricopeptide (TPR) repeat protein